MSSFLDKPFYLGLGLMDFSREKVEQLAEELIDKGELSKKDAQLYVSNLIKKGEDERQQFDNIIKDQLTKVLNDSNIARKEDILTREELEEIIKEQVSRILDENKMK